MGAAPSIFSAGESGRKSAKKSQLQQAMLEYLANDNYFYDPYAFFDEIALEGYTTLEQFISDIPPSRGTENLIYGQVIPPLAQLEMRYVLSTDPSKRGALAEHIVELPNKKLATLRMDPGNYDPSFFAKSVNILLWVFFPIRIIFSKFLQTRMLTNKPQYCNFDFDQLLLEKEHLRAYLPRLKEDSNLLVNYNHHHPHHHQPTQIIGNNQNQQQLVNQFSPEHNNDYYSPHQTPTSSSRGSPSQLEREIGLPRIYSQPSKEDPSFEVVVAQTQERVPQNQNKKKRRKGRKSSVTSGSEAPTKQKTAAPPPSSPLPPPQPVGTHRGIEGANNSCYMDSLLFSMFYTTNIFDYILEPKSTDDKFAKKTRRLLRENVVKPLRENYFCDYESLMNLRIHLSPKNEDLMGAFMDAEQIIYLLCEDVLKESQFIQYSGVDDDGWGDYMHLMNINAQDPSKIITVQQNVETSFAFNGDIKMANVPSPAFILGMPRSNRELIHYEAVIPNPEITIDGLLEPVDCQICEEENAHWEIRKGPNDIHPVCNECLSSGNYANQTVVSRVKMRLRSIVCIRGCHFVAFVRANNQGTGNHGNGNIKNRKVDNSSSWYFFDSMAGGYPEVKEVPGLENWLLEVSTDTDIFYTAKLPHLVKRSFTDGHLCIYEPIFKNVNSTFS